MQRLRKTAGDVVVVGAGVAGCSAFYHLAKLNRGNPAFKPILVDALPPLSLTSANGSFSYRNWFPSDAEAPMRELVVRSIDQLDEISKQTDNMIELNRNGYLFVTREPAKIQEFLSMGKKLESNGGGTIRVHEPNDLKGYRYNSAKIQYDLDGCDLLLGIDNIRNVFPALQDSNAIAALHVRRCGSMNPFKLGNYELTKATEYCPYAQIMRGKVSDIFGIGGRVTGLKIESDNGDVHHVSTPNVVLATGPLYEESIKLLRERDLSSFDIPILNELHARAVFDDPHGTVSAISPLTFDTDPMGKLDFTPEERKQLLQKPDASRMLEEFPGGVHVRPYTNSKMMAVWTYDTDPVPPKYPVEEVLDQNYPEICLRGLTRLFPQLKPYLSDPQVRSSFKVNGGYYCKTLDNMPLIGPAPNTIQGVFLQSAMSGIGLMSSGASGELLASHVMGIKPTHPKLAQHASAFLPERFLDKKYVESLGEGRSCMGQV
ncbi:TPA: hypothetical protein N0F65_009398 [Lagenidium giganteum]|uniref:FAD-dependent oxidoreductase domain-containing protein 1 n=1 Tax=Lagenidium giganteum TaxID=4803 RepID=A0AAV2ZCL1_9STRA|nr:TPA: hypothetical protein N0F65_009398 [Lagenidium giganteum]